MSLPIRTTADDIDAVCNFLVTKPTGATIAESKAVVDPKRLDGRKLNALRYWGFIDGSDERLKITERGRQCVRGSGAHRSQTFKDVIREVKPYMTAVERTAMRREYSVSATDQAAHWYEHFREESSGSDKILNDQAICFFQIAQGADLGTLILGRKGMPTRFEYDPEAVQSFVDGVPPVVQGFDLEEETEASDDLSTEVEEGGIHAVPDSLPSPQSNRVFVTHGKNEKILEQVKELVAYGRFEPVVAEERETAAKPVPQKIMDEMRTCVAAVIHVSIDKTLLDENGQEVPVINENVLIEIGAAMALYGTRFILLVREGTALPSNLQGLYECRYEGDELKMSAVMKLLKALSEF